MEEFPEEHSLIPVRSEDDLKPKIPYMKHLIQASKIINMWPNVNKRNPFIYNLVILIISINCFVFILTFIFRIKKDYNNMDGVTEMIDFLTVFISGLFRYLYIYFRGDEYLHLIYLIHNHFIHYSFFLGKHTGCLEKHYKLVNRIIITYAVFTFFWISQVCFTPILSFVWTTAPRNFQNGTETKEIPYPIVLNVYVPFDVYSQPANGLFYVYQVTTIFIFGIIYVVVDSFWYMVILLTIGQFELIKDSLTTLKEILNNNMTSANDCQLLEESEIQELEEGLKKCIKHHQFTRSVVHKIDDLNNPNILVDSLHAATSIGFILLDTTIALNNGDWNKVMLLMEYFIASIAHMFFFDWLGNELAVKEEELAEVIYEIPWYRCQKQRNAFLLITIQSRRPYRLTGGKMYKLSLEFFTSMIRAVFSYFTFLFQMRNGKPAS